MSTKLNKTIKCAVFDLDGTLLNTIKTINYYLNFALSKNGLGQIDEPNCKSFVGDGAVKLIHRALTHLGCDVDDLFDTVFTDYNEAYNRDPYYLTEPYEGISDALRVLDESGVKLAVLSNKPNFATRAAVEHFFPSTFDLVYGQRDGIPLKPSPEPILSMLCELSVTPDEVAYIGDSEPDIYTAQNASIALPISVTWGFRTRTQLISASAINLIDKPYDIINLIFSHN